MIWIELAVPAVAALVFGVGIVRERRPPRMDGFRAPSPVPTASRPPSGMDGPLLPPGVAGPGLG